VWRTPCKTEDWVYVLKGLVVHVLKGGVLVGWGSSHGIIRVPCCIVAAVVLAKATLQHVRNMDTKAGVVFVGLAIVVASCNLPFKKAAVRWMTSFKEAAVHWMTSFKEAAVHWMTSFKEDAVRWVASIQLFSVHCWQHLLAGYSTSTVVKYCFPVRSKKKSCTVLKGPTSTKPEVPCLLASDPNQRTRWLLVSSVA
jgi:hypothetical protein